MYFSHQFISVSVAVPESVYQAWELSKNAIFCSSETDFPQEKIIVYMGEKIRDTKRGSTGFSSTPKINCETFGGHSHMVITHLICFNCEHSCWLLLLWACNSTECSHPFMLLCHVLTEKTHEYSECFDSFTMSFTQVVSHGKNFYDHSYASK